MKRGTDAAPGQKMQAVRSCPLCDGQSRDLDARSGVVVTWLLLVVAQEVGFTA